MPKIDFKILAKKKGPLPVWAWALISAVLVYMLYRHFRSAGGDTGAGTPAAADTGTTSQQAPGDLLGNGADNAGNAGPLTASQEWGDAGIKSDFQDFMSQLESQALGSAAAGANDGSQTDPTTTGTDATGTDSAGIGLTHISGDYWWDKDQHKLIKIPGSGKADKGTGKKKVPNKDKAAGKKKAKHKIPKPHHKVTGRASVKAPKKHPGAHKPVLKRPGRRTKEKVTPQPNVRPLTSSQRHAIDRAHHPAPKRPIRKPPKRRVPIRNPRRPR